MDTKQLAELGRYVLNNCLLSAQAGVEPVEVKNEDGTVSYHTPVTVENVHGDWAYDFVSALLLASDDVDVGEPYTEN